MANRPLTEQDLALNEPLKWHIFDGEGRLLVKKGMVLRSERQIAKIIRLSSFIKTKDEEIDSELADSVSSDLSPFHHIDNVLNKLNKIFRYIVYKPANPEKKIPDKLMTISKNIVGLCEYDMDATLGAIHVGQEYDYTVIHPLHCAIISYSLAQKIGINDNRLNSIICAALTSNLGMFDLQRKLFEQQGPLNEIQRKEVEKHTMRSTVLLKRIGVIDKLWTEVVLQHHEKQDGTGYPRKLAGKDFILEARILAIADRYHAMVSPRTYRDSLSPTEALKNIFQGRGKEVDESLSAMLIKEMGIFPPGSYVQLASKEVAIVARRGEDRMKPLAKAIVAPDGRYYDKPKSRDTGDKKYRIAGLTNPPVNYDHNLPQLWDYDLD
ncbi:MAG: HD domain-containing phosphohydrolase [Gammaproteobacteria bacterium]|nr:HD domain-containing phosphohydrolase [Gammaproteobacteria bacterium]